MKVTTRDLVILGVFSALLCLGCWVFLKRINSGDSTPGVQAARPASKGAEEPATTPSRAAASAFVSGLPLGAIPPQYKLIVDRKLFTPLFTPPTRSSGGGGNTSRPRLLDLGPIPSIIPPAPVTGKTRVVPPAPRPPQPPTVVPPRPERPPLALTGLMRVGGNKAVIEHTRYGTARILGIGESAWGWQVAYIDVKRGVVGLSSTDPTLGKALVLKLGEKRRVEPLRSGYSDGGQRGPSPDSGRGDEGDEIG